MTRRLAVGLVLLLTGVLSVSQVERLPHAPDVRAQVPCVVTVHGVELTQSVQKSPLLGGGAGEAVTILAGRFTTARVYVTSTCEGDNVVAWMNLAHSASYGGPRPIDAQGVHRPITPPTMSSELNAVRASDDNRAFNNFDWRVSPRWGATGDEDFDIKVFACSLNNVQCNTLYNTPPRTRLPESIWSNGGPGVHVLPTQTFKDTNIPRILGFPVKQVNPLRHLPGQLPYIEPDEALIQPKTADKMIMAMLPLRDSPLPYEVTTAIIIEPLPADGLGALERDLWPMDNLHPILCDMETDKEIERGLRSDYLIALLPPDNYGLEGGGGGHAANYVAAVDVVPDPNFKTILAHEVHHAMGFEHYHSTGLIDEIGWDARRSPGYGSSRVRRPGPAVYDLIQDEIFSAPDGSRWMSKKNTNLIIAEPGIYKRENCVKHPLRGILEPPDPSPDPLEFLLVQASMSDGAPFDPEITSVTAHRGTENLTPLPPDDYATRLVDEAGIALYTSGMALAGPNALSGYSITVPDLPQTSRIELLHHGVIQDVITRTAHAPSVTLLAPTSSTALTDTTTVAWTAADVDGDALVYDLYWRPAGSGEDWGVIAIGVQTTTLTVETRDLPAATQGAFKVVARDGLNRAEAQVHDLTLANHPPRVSIVSPRTGDVFIQGEFINFQSSARDVDEPGWAVPSITWTSSLDGVISTDGDPLLGGGLPAVTTVSPETLSVGTHVLTVEACDSEGLCVTDSVTITVTS